ncbi:hypothetical protein [Roseibium sp.]|uniref:hypothetical protein n=1 Tax=Roseibium sp. TaxID=1936156 RepID=UPI003BA8669E
MTRTIIGFPHMSASALFGSRVAARRAGIITSAAVNPVSIRAVRAIFVKKKPAASVCHINCPFKAMDSKVKKFVGSGEIT